MLVVVQAYAGRAVEVNSVSQEGLDSGYESGQLIAVGSLSWPPYLDLEWLVHHDEREVLRAPWRYGARRSSVLR